jgi:hypothetical protein
MDIHTLSYLQFIFLRESVFEACSRFDVVHKSQGCTGNDAY